jgi:hypothetical protein
MAGLAIDFTLGSRRLLSVPRNLSTWGFSLEDVLAGVLPDAPASGRDGVRVLSAPTGSIAAVMTHYPGFIAGGRQDYHRHYIDMAQSYAAYVEQFSGKTRSTLIRNFIGKRGRGFWIMPNFAMARTSTGFIRTEIYSAYVMSE